MPVSELMRTTVRASFAMLQLYLCCGLLGTMREVFTRSVVAELLGRKGRKERAFLCRRAS
ncbi:hypothetical protein CUR178_05382 [Leishmania enriettii]|uniref:Uncharacterized protein n=1 Tax=Leishmania enriettii TaxID=5663 RepID=A0A836KEJ3_LEIEN|nr:hypothetical protein CUR178_02313 [Leishmania enriettii]KAG5473346.1 hypothetical protein CUR178_03266 [Leishmania enriettii]KAG5478803.1 hypothetical protein CUR178_05382 [Leishmania enriettii]